MDISLAGRLALAGCCAAALAACSTATYYGIDLRPGMAAPELQALAERARSGDKPAQLELGVRFEEGRGVAADAEAARLLYAAAAADTGGTRMIYMPAAGSGRVSTVPINAGPERKGLPAARARLAKLDAGNTNPAPTNRRRSLDGLIDYLGPSPVCTADRAAVERTAALPIGACSATAYRFIDRRGQAMEMVDLELTTSDGDAASTLHIPFGLIDAAESIYSDRGTPIRGRVTFESVAGSSGTIHIIRSFRKSH